MQNRRSKIAIIGGGIAGSSVALYLSQFNVDITLFEKENSLVSGPPMCHLHAGGNLYREIDDKQCIKLLKESIELLRFYPHAIDFRPTLLITPKEDAKEPLSILPRLKKLQKEYAALILRDPKNELLGKSSDYYKLYSKEDILALRTKTTPKEPKTLDEWIIPAAKEVDIEKIKFPLILVQEYGLNVFRIAATVTLLLEEQKNVTLKMAHPIKKVREEEKNFIIEEERFDYLINAAGFRSGIIDDMLKYKRERLVEFKAAYVTQWHSKEPYWPEIIFFGERATPQGMAQFTPYPDGYFQLHGMTKEITLFQDGLVKSPPNGSYALLPKKFIQKIEHQWDTTEIEERTKRAIRHMSRYIPAFKEAKLASKPLFGAQQVPGENITLRASEVSFEKQRYARCEIVKASSILTMAAAITQNMIEEGLIEKKSYKAKEFSKMLTSQRVTEYAEKICQERDYPKKLADVNYGVRERI